MNLNSIQNDVQLLKLYLKRFPQHATELAISLTAWLRYAYLEDYLVLASEYDNLVAQLKQLQQFKKAFVPQYPMTEPHLTLEQQFRVETFSRFLAQHHNESEFWAITYFHNFLILAEEYRQAEAEFDSMTDRLLAPKQPSLPSFL